MKIKGAMTVLNKRAEFYGTTTEELVQWLTTGSMKPQVLKHIEVYKQYHGCSSGVNYETWVKA